MQRACKCDYFLWDLLVVPILSLLDFVPPLRKMLDNIHHRVSHDAHMHVVPRHPTCLKNRNLVGDEVINLLEVHDATVVVVLSWEERASEIGRVTVCERAFMRDHDEHWWRL